jgi:hypothetical protein
MVLRIHQSKAVNKSVIDGQRLNRFAITGTRRRKWEQFCRQTQLFFHSQKKVKNRDLKGFILCENQFHCPFFHCRWEFF